MEIKFNNGKQVMSQMTLVNVLKKHKYYFAPINEYNDKLYYCIIKCEKENAATFFYNKFKWARIKKHIKYIEQPLCLYICSCISEDNYEPIVFTQMEVENILYDVPENYVGGNEI